MSLFLSENAFRIFKLGLHYLLFIFWFSARSAKNSYSTRLYGVFCNEIRNSHEGWQMEFFKIHFVRVVEQHFISLTYCNIILCSSALIYFEIQFFRISNWFFIPLNIGYTYVCIWLLLTTQTLFRGVCSTGILWNFILAQHNTISKLHI